MYKRDKSFYDIVSKGLASMGYTGDQGFSAYVQDMFAEKYNAERTFAQMGFPLNPDIPINPTYEQIEATVRPYTMASYVDYDSDGPTKSTDGLALKMGGLPLFKHEVSLSRKILREKMQLANAIGGTTPEIEETVMSLLFNGIDDLIGGNYNTMAYQRHQIVSNMGILHIDSKNNPLGVPLEIDFNVPKQNIKISKWYTKDINGTVTEAPEVTAGKVDPIKEMRRVRIESRTKDFAPAGHWEVAYNTYEDLIALPYFRKMYAISARPDIAEDANRLAWANTIEDDVVKAYIERQIGARIEVIDAMAFIEKYNTKTQKVEYTNLDSFNEGVFVYVPDEALGDAQFARPIFMETPGARVTLFDGGRTLIRQVFEDETMTQTIKSEVQGLIVPNKTRWMYYLKIKGDK